MFVITVIFDVLCLQMAKKSRRSEVRNLDLRDVFRTKTNFYKRSALSLLCASGQIYKVVDHFVVFRGNHIFQVSKDMTCLDFVRAVASEHAERTGAGISVEVIQCEPAGRKSSTDTVGFNALCDAVESVTGNRPEAVGVGGGTCANFFRLDGFDAYVWQCGGGTLHAPNEYVEMSNLMTDAKVFATLFYNLCVRRRE